MDEYAVLYSVNKTVYVPCFNEIKTTYAAFGEPQQYRVEILVAYAFCPQS